MKCSLKYRALGTSRPHSTGWGWRWGWGCLRLQVVWGTQWIANIQTLPLQVPQSTSALLWRVSHGAPSSQ